MRKTLILMVFLIGCIGSPEPRHPYRDGRSAVKPWWAPSTVDVPRDQNPWEKFVGPAPVDEFELLSRYDVGPWASSASQLQSESFIVAPRIYLLRLRAKRQAEKRKAKAKSSSKLY